MPSTVTATAHGGTLPGSNESGLSRRFPRRPFGLSASGSPVAGSKYLTRTGPDFAQLPLSQNALPPP